MCEAGRGWLRRQEAEGSVLTIAKLGAWSVSYYVDTARSASAAALESRAAGGGLGEYYSESETRLPVWFSAGRTRPRRGLTGAGRDGESADLDAVTRWLDDGNRRGASGRAFGKRASVHGFDLTFCAPKSVSLMRGLGDDVTGKAVSDAHALAIAEAMEYLAVHGATPVCTIRAQVRRIWAASGDCGGGFQHETSRAGTRICTHVLVPNRQARGRAAGVAGRDESLSRSPRGGNHLPNHVAAGWRARSASSGTTLIRAPGWLKLPE
ncbi:relaxase domain-containing protein [Mycolicibacterium murale]